MQVGDVKFLLLYAADKLLKGTVKTFPQVLSNDGLALNVLREVVEKVFDVLNGFFGLDLPLEKHVAHYEDQVFVDFGQLLGLV